MRLVVSMCCELTIDPPVDDVAQITRDHLRCRIIYCSTSKFSFILVHLIID